MIFLLQHFFLLATDLVLAMTLSCLFYAFACVSIAFLTCCVIIFSFGTAERNVDVKRRAIVILVSNSSIGRMFARNLDKAGFGVSAAQWSAQEARTVTEECSSNKEVAQLHLTEDEYQKTVKTFIESHLSLKGPAEEGHFGSQSTHHEASCTADTLGGVVGNPSQHLLRAAAIQDTVLSGCSSPQKHPVDQQCLCKSAWPRIHPPIHCLPAGSRNGSLHTSSGFQTECSAACMRI
ncbi:uncharacterized protein LOC131578321 isoform X1 [Poecile atricapillus]|uniref:uncharacterized protein LOC131578321 isoform X1 n=1 Tax=Poecile atricapillus TaxID=48891 RepID=UPI0027392CAF|nr:uncharacterized protein LOC131578321 isoform X1 [Poecile atricapillus]